MSPLPHLEPRRAFAADLDAAVADLRALAAGGDLELAPPTSPALLRLRHRFRLAQPALRFVCWSAALALDPGAVLAAEAAGDAEARRGLSVPEFCRWLDLAPPDARRLTRDLTHLEALPILEALDPRSPASGNRFRASRALVAWLDGRDAPEPPLRALARLDEALLVHHDGREEAELEAALSTPDLQVVAVDAAAGADAEARLAGLLAARGRRALLLDLDETDDEQAVAAARELAAACLMRSWVPVVRAQAARPALRRRLEAALRLAPTPLVCLGESAGELFGDERRAALRLSPPDTTARREMWRSTVALADGDLDELARRYQAGGARIQAACARAGTTPSRRAVEDALRALSREACRTTATLFTPARGWDDLIVPEAVRGELDLLVARVRHAHTVLDRWRLGPRLGARGGVVGLLSGQPGTGKTLAAEVIAAELGLDVLQLDLAQATSRWVGETEKNLARVFDAAEAGGALLLLDEADALLSRRSPVASTSDRWANLGVNHLLMRLDAFRGVALLTTNLESSLDPALRRRLAAQVSFPAPGPHELARLWRRALAPELPLRGEVDVEALARRHPRLVGATVRNAVLRAAFRAAGAGRLVEPEDLEEAASAESGANDGGGRLWDPT